MNKFNNLYLQYCYYTNIKSVILLKFSFLNYYNKLNMAEIFFFLF